MSSFYRRKTEKSISINNAKHPVKNAKHLKIIQLIIGAEITFEFLFM
jgi:hypothetical protein